MEDGLFTNLDLLGKDKVLKRKFDSNSLETLSSFDQDAKAFVEVTLDHKHGGEGMFNNPSCPLANVGLSYPPS